MITLQVIPDHPVAVGLVLSPEVLAIQVRAVAGCVPPGALKPGEDKINCHFQILCVEDTMIMYLEV